MTVPDYVRMERHEWDLDDDGHDQAEHVVYDPTASGMAATNVQDAIDELAAAGGPGGSALEVLDEGVSLDTAVTSIDVTGAGATASHVGHAVTINVPGAGTSGYVFMGPLMVDNPNIVTTDGNPIWTPLVTSDGVPIFIEYAAP